MISLLRDRNIALVSFTLCLISPFWLLPCAIVSMTFSRKLGTWPWEHGMLFLWLCSIAAAIWWLGKRYAREEWNMDLTILKFLQIAVLVAFLPAFGVGKGMFQYVSWVTEILQFGALVIYGLFSLRVGRRPGLAYCGYLALTAGLILWSYHSLEKAVQDMG